jgi:hypothetical protein
VDNPALTSIFNKKPANPVFKKTQLKNELAKSRQEFFSRRAGKRKSYQTDSYVRDSK